MGGHQSDRLFFGFFFAVRLEMSGHKEPVLSGLRGVESYEKVLPFEHHAEFHFA